jgi:SNF2 family DNA or RNA helicase
MALREYQRRIADHILVHPRCGVFAEMGLGKTLATLTAMPHLPQPILVVAPKRVAETVWEQEAEKFGIDLTFSSILGSRARRVEAVAERADVYLVNVDNFVWLREQYEKAWKWKTIVFDESSLFKTPGSKRSRAALWAASRAEHVIELTGTPAPNGLHDIYHQIKILDSGARLGSSVVKFRKRYCYPENPYFQHTRWLVREDMVPVIHEAISDICISLRQEDYLELPDRVINDVTVPLSPKARRAYDTLKADMMLNLGDDTVWAETAGALVTKLGQCASGAIYYEDKDWEQVHDDKLKALVDIVEEAEGAPVLVWYQYAHSALRIRQQFNGAVNITEPDAVQEWNAGNIPVLIAHPASGGHGLNLQHGGNIAVWFDATWNLEHYDQANARLHRSGQDKPVIIHRLVAEDTIDSEIYNALVDKTSVQELLMRGLS